MAYGLLMRLAFLARVSGPPSREGEATSNLDLRSEATIEDAAREIGTGQGIGGHGEAEAEGAEGEEHRLDDEHFPLDTTRH